MSSWDSGARFENYDDPRENYKVGTFKLSMNIIKLSEQIIYASEQQKLGIRMNKGEL